MAKTTLEPGSFNIDSISFDLTNYVQKIKQNDKYGWLDEEKGVANLLRFNSERASWTFKVNELDKASQFYGEQCSAAGGAVLVLKNIEVDGSEALYGIFKYRAKPGQMPLMYVGIIWIPFDNCIYQINVESLEQGTTGTREAAIMLKLGDDWPMSDEPAVVVKTAEELFSRMRNAKLRVLPSDREEYDELFPEHPLTKVRARLQKILDTVKFEAPNN
ncbi:hypothetical protein KF728_29635 [Candidatus Obscuribacterales bacterium]|nr:hypothetical protein [Candidatus Obscuribacterales bacterium]MBX3154351.1 hypothetical protein [Candidatus Obscuribacterales bacterium]